MLDRRLMRAARTLLDWDQKRLGDEADVSLATIQRMERHGPEHSKAKHVQQVQTALENGGITFLSDDGAGPGMRVRTPDS